MARAVSQWLQRFGGKKVEPIFLIAIIKYKRRVDPDINQRGLLPSP